jgi:hypothetical protein
MEHDGPWRQLAVLDCRVLRSSVRTGRCSAWRGWPVVGQARGRRSECSPWHDLLPEFNWPASLDIATRPSDMIRARCVGSIEA